MKKMNVDVYVGGEFRYGLRDLELPDGALPGRLDFSMDQACKAALKMLRGGRPIVATLENKRLQ